MASEKRMSQQVYDLSALGLDAVTLYFSNDTYVWRSTEMWDKGLCKITFIPCEVFCVVARATYGYEFGESVAERGWVVMRPCGLSLIYPPRIILEVEPVNVLAMQAYAKRGGRWTTIRSTAGNT